MSIYGAKTADAPKYQDDARDYDAILVMSFGGPDGPDDVMPFLENVTRGRNVPRERLLEVAEHYYHFGGVSPINEQNLALIATLEQELRENGPNLPVYYGNRNWHPLITDTVQQMKDDGIQRAIAFFTSSFSSYSGCRQYREDIQRAIETVGEGAPEIDKIRVFYNHPGFIHPVVEKISGESGFLFRCQHVRGKVIGHFMSLIPVSPHHFGAMAAGSRFGPVGIEPDINSANRLRPRCPHSIKAAGQSVNSGGKSNVCEPDLS